MWHAVLLGFFIVALLDAVCTAAEPYWNQFRGPYANGETTAKQNSSGHIYFLSKEGKVLIVAAKDEFELVAEKQFPDGFNASPAVVGDSLLLRSFTHLYLIRK